MTDSRVPLRGLVLAFVCALASACGSSISDAGQSGSAGSASTPAIAGASATGGSSGSSSAGVAGSAPATAGGTGGFGATANNGGAAGGVAAAGESSAAGNSGSGSAGTAGSAGAHASGGTGPLDPGTQGDGEIEVGPNYTASPDGKLKPNAPAGFSVSFDLGSSVSKIFTGDDFDPKLTFTRQIKVWVPAQYADGGEAPFMISSDGFYGGLQTVVQNLAGDPDPNHRVPPLVIIGVQNGPNNNPSERSLEYDTVSDRYSKFVNDEVLTQVVANAALKAKYPNFKLTSDPNGRGGYGCSSGGPAVMGLAWFGGFNRVFSFSGSFVAIRPNAEHPLGAWEYPSLIGAAPLRPGLRVFLEVGEQDNGYNSAESTHRSWPISNRNFAAALKAKGNHYRYVFAKGAGHCDDAARNQVMPEGLIWLWRGYQTP